MSTQYADYETPRDEHPIDHPDSAMKKVLDTLACLGGLPVETLTPEVARRQPTPTDAVLKILRGRHVETPPRLGVVSRDLTKKGAVGPIKARLYRPEGSEKGDLPIACVTQFNMAKQVAAGDRVPSRSASRARHSP